MITFIRHLRDCTSGTALLETTIIFPLVLTLMVGIIEFGRAFQDYHTADKSMRSAARYLSRVPEAGICNWGWDNARRLAVFGTLDQSVTDPLLPAMTEDDLALDPPACGGAFPDPLTFTITADVPIQVQLLSAIGLPSTITIQVRHEERHIGG